MKKILFLIESLSGGGAEKVLLDIVKNIDNNKFDITVVAVVDTGVYSEEIRKYCTYKFILPNPEKIKTFRQGLIYKIKYKLLYNLNPKIIYRMYIKDEYYTEIAFVEGFCTKLIGASTNKNSKKIAWVHIDMQDNPYADNYFKNHINHKLCYLKFDSIICVSNSVANSMRKKFNLENNIIVQYNPIDAYSIVQKSKENISIKENKRLKMVSVGRLVNQKGYDRLLNLLYKLKNEGIDFECWIIGEGEQENNLKNTIKHYKLDENIKLLGFQENPYKYMAKCDLFICSSRVEGYSLVIAEALVLGIPVISTNCSGPNELLNYGEYGLLVQNSDSGLYLGLKFLLNNQHELQLLKKKSKLRGKCFKLNKNIKEIERIIE